MKDKSTKLVETVKKNKKTMVDANVDDRKQKLGILGIGILFLILICVGIYWAAKKDTTVLDAVKFKKEYESVNCSDKDNCDYKEVSIEEKNPIVYSSYEEIFKILENGTGVIYFGFPECPWCRELIPVMLDAAKEAGMGRIYYLNNREDRNTLELDENGKVKLVKNGTEEYFRLLERLDSVLNGYKLYDSKGKEKVLADKRLYFPTILFVKDGAIVDFHEGTLESQENPKANPLTEEEKQELKQILADKMLKTITCDGAC